MLGLALLCAMVGDSAQAQQNNPAPPQQTAPADPRGTEQTPLIVKTIKSPEEAAEEAKDRNNKATNDTITNLIAFLVGAATFAQFGALVVIISTTRRQLRAYITVQAKDINLHNSEDDRYVLTFTIKNTGQTPAYDLQISSRGRLLPRAPDERFNFQTSSGDDPSNSMLGPGDDFEHDSVSEDVGDAEITDPTSTAPHLYFWGSVTYRHTFQWRWLSRRRYTNFCVVIVDDTRSESDSAYVGHATEHHNDAN